MIDIKTIEGEQLMSVPILQDAVIHEELMASEYVALSWNSDTNSELPVGAYVEVDGERYSLYEPYAPTMVNEGEYRYSPTFYSRVEAWNKQPACVYTYEDDGVTVKTREFDWSFVGSPADAMQIVKQAIKNETGESWTIMLSDSLPSSIEISSQTSSIASVLSEIASMCQTEYWVDKKSNVLHLSKCEHGDPITLKVGDNVGLPSVMSKGNEYFTRYYALGSSRNITQPTGNVNGSVNKRLTLSPSVYPMGYKDIKGHFENGVFVSDLKQGEVFSKVVIFDDIYPSSDLKITDVRPRMKYRLDAGKKVKIGGTDENPVYDQYAIWYFKINNFDFSEDLLIEGLPLSVHFKSGRLAGQEFELIYHDKTKTENTEGDVIPFDVQAGDYEIKFKESSGTIIPDFAYIIPQDEDEITLFNIELPSEYTEAAQQRLLEALDKAIAQAQEDSNTYEVESNPIAFYESDTTVSLGQKVSFVNGEKRLETRALMVERKLDYSCEQKIRVGNDPIQSSTKELRENVASLNHNVDVLSAFNDLSRSIQDSYGRTQALINEAVASVLGIWTLDEDGNLVTEKQVLVKGNLVADGEISAGGAGEEGDFSAEGTVTGIKVEEGNIIYPDNNGTVDLSDVLEDVIGGIDLTPFATKDEVDNRFDELVNGAPAALDTLKEIADALAENDNEIGAIVTEIGTKASKTEVAAIDSKYATEVGTLKEKNTAQDTAHSELAKRVSVNESKIESINGEIDDINQKNDEQDESIAQINDGLPTIKQWYNEVGRKIGYDEHGIYTRENFRSYKEISAGGYGQEDEGGGGSGEIGGIQIEIIDKDFPDTPEGIYQEGSQVIGYDNGKGIWTNKVTMYKHQQSTSSDKWTITHNLGKMPNVKVIDSQGELVFGTVVYDKNDLLNKLTITFGGAFAGTAYLD